MNGMLIDRLMLGYIADTLRRRQETEQRKSSEVRMF